MTCPANPPTSEPLIGRWGCETVLGPAVNGALRISRDGDAYVATIGGLSAAVYVRPETPSRLAVTFTLPDDQGAFRGHANRELTAIDGHWIQPPRRLVGTSYATPVQLCRIARDAWQGEVVPLVERLALYVTIAAGEDGQLNAFLRNPEYNLGRGASYVGERIGDSVSFRNPHSENDHLTGAYDTGADLLTLTLARLGLTLAFSRRPVAAAEPYVYQPPVPCRDDAWVCGTLAEAGLDPALIGSLIQSIRETVPSPQPTPAIQGLLIARRGKLVLEEYFQGFDRERPHDMRSASKTFASLLVGAAIESGAPLSVTTPVDPLFPTPAPAAAHDPRRAQLTIAHLMTMTSGLSCDDNDDDSPGNEDRMQRSGQPDWYRYTLDLPQVHAPGERYVYCSGAVNLIGGAVRAVTGTWLPEFFRRHVGEPLQMGPYHINLMPTGEAYAGGGMHLRPRDALKLGQLYLDGGVWNGRRVISSAWVAESVAHHVDVGDGSSDGYNWHRHSFTVGGRTYEEYDASGNGGQLVMVFPELELAVAIFAGNYGQYGVWRKFRDELVPQYIVAAVRD